MSDDFSVAIENLVQKAPKDWLASACDALRAIPANYSVEAVRHHLPVTHNADLSCLIMEVVRLASGKMSWEALSWTLCTTSACYSRWKSSQHIELLWAGPAPSSQIPARRIDQALYDLIAEAKREILLVTFAATRIERLTGELLKAIQRGVNVRLVLEFEQTSEGQLSYDALKAFPPALIRAADVFCWPIEKRERNQAGRPGKLHAKLVISDDTALVSSANLTDDAFNRNLEVGVMVKHPGILNSAKCYLDTLIMEGTLVRCRPPSGTTRKSRPPE